MSFLREWLPITTRNRVALALAFSGLVMFLVWNCLPYYEYGDIQPKGIVATSAWPSFFSPDVYLMVFKDPSIQGFFEIATYMAIIQNAFVNLAAVPFWKYLQASSYVRLPLGIVNFLGGAIMLWNLYRLVISKPVIHDFQDSWITLVTLETLNMFVISAALFIFRNELGLRSERAFSRNGGAS